MRIVIASLALVLVAGLAAPSDASAAGKKKHRHAGKTWVSPEARRYAPSEYGTDASPEKHQYGSSAWWRAMDRIGKGGFRT